MCTSGSIYTCAISRLNYYRRLTMWPKVTIYLQTCPRHNIRCQSISAAIGTFGGLSTNVQVPTVTLKRLCGKRGQDNTAGNGKMPDSIFTGEILPAISLRNQASANRSCRRTVCTGMDKASEHSCAVIPPKYRISMIRAFNGSSFSSP